MTDCLFCKIIDGKIPAAIVASANRYTPPLVTVEVADSFIAPRMLVNNWYNEQSHFQVICLDQCAGTAGVPACPCGT